MPAAAFSILIGCAQLQQIKPVGPGNYVVAATYSIEPQKTWTFLGAKGKTELWTMDGPGLQSLRFVKGLADGDNLLEEKKGLTLPKFRSRMNESEIMEFVVDSMEATALSRVKAIRLRPARFGSQPGFRFDLEFLTSNGLEMEGRVIGAVIDKKLHLIMYYGTRRVYFPKHLHDVEKLFASIKMVPRK